MIGLPASDRDLQKAIELKCSQCYRAMSVANSLGGSPSRDWTLARAHKLPDLVAEARRRQLDMASWKPAVIEEVLCDTAPYRDAIARIHRLESHGATLSDEGWRLDGVYLGQTVQDAIEGIGCDE